MRSHPVSNYKRVMLVTLSLSSGFALIMAGQVLCPVVEESSHGQTAPDAGGWAAGWSDEISITQNTAWSNGSWISGLASEGRNVYMVFEHARLDPNAENFHGSIDGVYNVYFTRSADGGMTWSAGDNGSRFMKLNSPIEDVTWGFAMTPTIAVSNSTVHAAWQQNPTGTVNMGRIRYRRSIDSGQAWEDEKFVFETLNQSFNPMLLAEGDSVHLFWEEFNSTFDGGRSRIYYSRSLDRGATWEAKRELARESDFPGPTGTSGCYIGSATKDADRLFLSFLCGEMPTINYFMMSPDNGSTWEDGQGNEGGRTTLMVNPPGEFWNGLSMTVWMENVTTVFMRFDFRDVIWYQILTISSRDSGKTWGAPQLLVDHTDDQGYFDCVVWRHMENCGTSAWHPMAAYVGPRLYLIWADSRADRAFLSWQEVINYDLFIMVSEDSGLTWGQQTKLTDTYETIHRARMWTADGVIHLAWNDEKNVERRNFTENILYKRYPDFDVTLPSVETLDASKVTADGATLNGWMPSLGNYTMADAFFEWRQQGSTTWTKVGAGEVYSPDGFDDSLSGLYPDTTYEFRAGASTEAEVLGGVLTFRTRVSAQLPVSTVNALPMYTSTTTSAVSGTANGNASVVANVELFYRREGGQWLSWGLDSAAPWEWVFNVSATGGDGFYEFYSIATDERSYIEEPPRHPDTSTTVDREPPTSAVETLLTATARTSFILNASAADSLSGVAGVELLLRRNDGPWISYGVDQAAPWSWVFDTTTVGGDGFYEFYSLASDAASNVEQPPMSPDTSILVDVTAPDSNVIVLPDYSNVGLVTLTANAVDSTSDVKEVELLYRKDGGQWASWSTDSVPPWSWEFDTATTGGDGLYEFISVATDLMSNHESAPPQADTAITIDTKPPVSDVERLPPTIVNATFRITARSSDGLSGTASVELFYRRNGGTWASYGVDTAQPWSWVFSTDTTGGGGFYEFYSIATDAALNIEVLPVLPDAATSAVTLGPIVKVMSPANGTTLFQGQVTIRGQAFDAAEVETVEISADRVSWTPANGTLTWWANVTLAEGSNVIFVRATDILGNSTIMSITIHFSAPSGGEEPPASEQGWFIILLAVTVLEGFLILLGAILKAKGRKETSAQDAGSAKGQDGHEPPEGGAEK